MSRSTVCHRGELGEGQGDLLVDVAVDGERPRVDVDGGDGEPGVDAVEVGVRRPQRADAVVLSPRGPAGRKARGRWRPAARCRSRRGGTTSPSGRAPPWPLRPRRGRRSPARPRAGSDRRPHATTDRDPGRTTRCSHHSEVAATTAATRAGRRSSGPEPGRRTASTPATPASPTRMSRPTVSRRSAITPAIAASSSTTTVTEPTSTSLSAVPNCRIANSLSGVGVRSMTVEPTASTGEAAGTVRAATRCPAARPTSVARTPYAAWSRVRRRSCGAEVCMAGCSERAGPRMGRAAG